ncbi:hypothetical protein B0H17DRAFT_1179307 [Mycena rosella]|uniref:Uncharacterized protein n=1 Tax=Mycena rosella TaxID=1033263 RepID=A0AAD7DKP7_MYCRO|nr:hypothetical protein B0H17DRAFT_1179307 [Mycena rosella]
MSLTGVVEMVLQINPVPGLSFAFTLFTFIVSAVNEVQSSKTQLELLAAAIGQLLVTLNAEFRGATRLRAANFGRPLMELKILLEDIHRFVEKEQGRGFINALLNKDSRIATIEGFYRRIGITVSTFQISALLHVERFLRKNKNAQERDNDILNALLKVLETSHMDLRRTHDTNQNNMITMMIAIQRKLDAQEHSSSTEHRFLSHTLQYLGSSSGKQVHVEDWMISAFEGDLAAEIGRGDCKPQIAAHSYPPWGGYPLDLSPKLDGSGTADWIFAANGFGRVCIWDDAIERFVEIVVWSDIRPQRPNADECPRRNDFLWRFAESCWAADAKARPSATYAHDLISQIISCAGTPAHHSIPSAVRGPRTDIENLSSPSSHGLSKLASVRPAIVGRQHSSSSTGKSNEDLWGLKELQVAALQKRQRVLGNKDSDTLSAMRDLGPT